ncbi:heterokaryon incompatibility protein-domain-containing protein [Alternaria alternata]|nr:heterokaryon incompatibility protein-domain-containing protein [Alternaria alternata]
MQYEPLEKTKNDIRVLRFLDPLRPISAEDSIECTIENVPLEEGSFSPQSDQSYIPNPKCPMGWDRFTKCVDLRDATLEGLTLDEATTEGLRNQAHKQVSDTRFAWGDFEALSYTWGDVRDVKSIILNGVRKDVSKNLESALRALRDLQETRLGMHYWVDSLCINQEDEEERNEQVKRMRGIYRRARAVVVWLGQEESTDKIAVQTMWHLCRNPCIENTLELPKDLRLDGWPALFAFAQKPYWNRAWIIQELAANHNSTLLLCGRSKLTRRMIRLGATYCRELLTALQDQTCQSDLDSKPGSWPIVSSIYWLTMLTSNSNAKVSLSRLMHLVRRFDATDKRDKVYSMLGLLDPTMSRGIAPDYSRSVQEVYTGFMMSVVESSGGLDYIASAGIHPTEKDWPSWVPDWRLTSTRHHIEYLRSRSAGGNLPTQVPLIKQGKRSTLLVCSGLQVDIVDGTAAEPPLHRSTQPRYALNRYGSRKSEALQQTLLMGHPKATPGTIVGYPKASTGVLKSGVIQDVLLKVLWPLEHSSSP